MATKPRGRRKTLTKALERRIIAEAECECPWCEKAIPAAEMEIHHIDGDRTNNEFTNLMLVCRNHHGQIGASLIPLHEVQLKKQMMANRAEMVRLGFMKPSAAPPIALVAGDNSGIVGGTVNVGTVRISRGPRNRRRSATFPGLVEADPDMRTYATYLLRRYVEWRIKGVAIDGRHFSPKSGAGILTEGFGSGNSVLLIQQSRFFEWVAQAQSKIDNTTFGRGNRARGSRNYHSWEEHLRERHGRSSRVNSHSSPRPCPTPK